MFEKKPSVNLCKVGEQYELPIISYVVIKVSIKFCVQTSTIQYDRPRSDGGNDVIEYITSFKLFNTLAAVYFTHVPSLYWRWNHSLGARWCMGGSRDKQHRLQRRSRKRPELKMYFLSSPT